MAPPSKKDQPPSVVDALADDAIPADYPPGTPELRPMLQIRPRSRRAEFKRKYGEFASKQEQVQQMQRDLAALGDDDTPEKNAARLRLWAETDDFYQLVDEMLAIAATDPDAYQRWSDEVGDVDLMTVFNVYSKRAQPGEASSSTS